MNYLIAHNPVPVCTVATVIPETVFTPQVKTL